MDKNTITGFVLIALLLFAFSWFNQPSPEQRAQQQRLQDSIAAVQTAQQQTAQQAAQAELNAEKESFVSDSAKMAALENKFGAFAGAVEGEDKIITLQNEVLALKVSSKGGMLTEALLKDYNTYDSLPVILFDAKDDKYGFSLITASNRVINTADMYFTPVAVTDSSVVMRLAAGTDNYVDFVYTIHPDSYVVNFDIRQKNMNAVLSPSATSINMFWDQKMRRQEKGRKFEEQYSNLYYKFTADDVEYLNSGRDEKETVSNRVKWFGYKNQFFTSALISRDGFNGATFDSRVLKDDSKYLKTFRTETDVDFDLRKETPASFDFFLGPNSYPLLRKLNNEIGPDEDLQLDKLVPLGASVFRWVNKFLVIPVFTFLGKFISNYGIIILLLTIFIKLLLMPFTFKSYMSQAKMRVLRPEIQEINAKYPGKEKAMERQQATMKLYGEAGINPMGGCLPMLLQMPILFAMFQFFPSSIELRGESFLWAHDLSTYDSIFSWDTYIPLITPYFGNHISLFCLLMTVTNLIYIKISMGANSMGQEQMPGMKAMQYMMPIMFLVFFNNYAAGLSYYYFVSLLITIGQTYLFRLFISEDKLLAEMKANAKKPKKKSGFMARLEEAQRQQQATMRKQQNKK